MKARREVELLLWCVGMAAAVWALSLFSRHIAEAGTPKMDERILRSLRDPQNPKDALGPRWFERAMRDLTVLGSWSVLTVVMFSFGGVLISRRRFWELALMLALFGGAVATDRALKLYFLRPRPEIVPHLDYVNSPSFPSGHALQSLVVYGIVGTLAARLVKTRGMKIYILTIAAGLAFLVGSTRVYLGVHYPSDVLAGWFLGFMWLIPTWRLTRPAQPNLLSQTEAGGR